MLLLTNSRVAAELEQLQAALPPYLRWLYLLWLYLLSVYLFWLQAALPLVRYAPRGGGGGGGGAGWRTLQHESIVEQILASTAESFLAGPWHYDKVSSSLLTAYYSLLTAYYSLLTAYCLLATYYVFQ